MSLRFALTVLALAPAAALAAPAGAPAPAPPAAADPRAPGGAGTPPASVAADGDWRAARWGMTVEEVLAAFPRESFRLEPPLRLADGNVVAVGIDRYALGARSFRVRFVFEGGKLALVSLRTPEESPARPEDYVELQKVLTGRFGGPGEATADAEFIDMRQTRWKLGRSSVDLKYVPGVIVVLYHPS